MIKLLLKTLIATPHSTRRIAPVDLRQPGRPCLRGPNNRPPVFAWSFGVFVTMILRVPDFVWARKTMRKATPHDPNPTHAPRPRDIRSRIPQGPLPSSLTTSPQTALGHEGPPVFEALLAESSSRLLPSRHRPDPVLRADELRRTAKLQGWQVAEDHRRVDQSVRGAKGRSARMSAPSQDRQTPGVQATGIIWMNDRNLLQICEDIEDVLVANDPELFQCRGAIVWRSNSWRGQGRRRPSSRARDADRNVHECGPAHSSH